MIALTTAYFCEEHGDELEILVEEADYEINPGFVAIRVVPCERCKQEAFEQGYTRGQIDASQGRRGVVK